MCYCRSNSLQFKGNELFIITKLLYALSHEFPNNFRLSVLENLEFSHNCQMSLDKYLTFRRKVLAVAVKKYS